MGINKELIALILFPKEPYLTMRDLMYHIGIKRLTEYQQRKPKQREEQATSSNQPPKMLEVSKE